LPLILGVATVGGLVVFAIAWLAGRSIQRPVVTGVQGMVGTIAEAMEDFATEGRVRYGGEIWNAVTSSPLRTGQRARIARVEGLKLWVEPL
jgi:membrane-bound serine protease (ClpP class)